MKTEKKIPIEKTKPIGLLNRDYHHDNDATAAAAAAVTTLCVLNAIKREMTK